MPKERWWVPALIFFDARQERSSSEQQHLKEGLPNLIGVCSGITSYTDTSIDMQTNTNALTNILLMLMPIPIPILLNANINASTISDTNYLYKLSF